MIQTWQVWVTSFSALVALGLTIGAVVLTRRKLYAEGTGIITEAATRMIQNLEHRLAAVEARAEEERTRRIEAEEAAEKQRAALAEHLARQDRQLADLQRGISILSQQIRALGHEPAFVMPNPFDGDKAPS